MNIAKEIYDLVKGQVSNQRNLGLYDYQSSTIGDTIGDTRISNQAGVYIIEKCTLGNAVKGAGTWITIISNELPANTIIGNNTATTTSQANIAIGVNQVLGRLSANIVPVDVTSVLSARATLIAGQCTVTDTSITVNSWAVVCVSTVGVSTSVPIKFTAAAGSMLFSTGQVTDTCDFGYIIFY